MTRPMFPPVDQARRHFDADIDVVLEDFQRSFLSPWRERVLRHAPSWVDSFDLLVAEAVADARAGTTGRSATVDTIAPPPAPVASTA